MLYLGRTGMTFPSRTLHLGRSSLTRYRGHFEERRTTLFKGYSRPFVGLSLSCQALVCADSGIALLTLKSLESEREGESEGVRESERE